MAQTNVTGTATDNNTTPYINGTWTANLFNPTTFQPTWQGSTSFNTSFGGALDGTGSFAVTLPSNTGAGSITVGGLTTTQWTFAFFTVDGENGFGVNVTITGASQSITASIISVGRIIWETGDTNPPSCGSGQAVVSLGAGVNGCGAAGGSGFPVVTPVTVGTGGSITTTGSGVITATNGLAIVAALPNSCVSGTSFNVIVTGVGEFFCGPSNVYVPVGGASISQFPPGLLAWYRCAAGDTVASLVDYSGNGNNATGTVGTAPTIIAGSGGCNFTGNGAISLPSTAGLIAANSIQVLVGYQQSNSGGNIFNGVLASTGTNGTILMLCQGNSCWTESGSETTVSSVRFFSLGAGGEDYKSRSFMNGTGVVSAVLNTVGSGGTRMYVNAKEVCISIVTTNPVCVGSGNDARGHNNGNWQIGGGAAGTGGVGTQSYFTGQIYGVAFYSTSLNAAQVAQGAQALINDATNRGITLSLTPVDTGYQIVYDGDSQTAGGGAVAIHYPVIVKLNQPFASVNQGGIGTTLFVSNALASLQVDPQYRPNAQANVDFIWLGVNDCGAGRTPAQMLQDLASNVAARKKVGWRVGFMNHGSNTGADTCKNNWNTNIRQNWRNIGLDMFVDNGSSVLGADGASTNTLLYVDGLHPTQASQYNIISPNVQHAINAFYGNNDFSTAATYTTTATAAVAVTAATQAGNTMTFTTAANTFAAGQCIVVTGVTPAGYNSTTANSGSGCWFAITAPNNTTFTAWNNTTGLGALTVAGTASTAQEQDADVYAILGGAAAGPIHTLQSCVARTGQSIFRKITNTNAAPWVITPYGSEQINGAATLTTPVASATNNPIIRLDSILVSSSAAGCNWRASIQ